MPVWRKIAKILITSEQMEKEINNQSITNQKQFWNGSSPLLTIENKEKSLTIFLPENDFDPNIQKKYIYDVKKHFLMIDA